MPDPLLADALNVAGSLVSSGIAGGVAGSLAGALVSAFLGKRHDSQLLRQGALIDQIEQTRDDVIHEIAYGFQMARNRQPPANLGFGAAMYPTSDRSLIGDQRLADECLAVMGDIFMPRETQPSALTSEEEARITDLMRKLRPAFAKQLERARSGNAPTRCKWPT